MRSLWERWKRFARVIGDFQARLILTLLYFCVLGPFALIVQKFSDPLAIKHTNLRGWQPKAQAQGSPMEQAQRQSQ